MMAAELGCDDFIAHLGSTFALLGEGGAAMPLTLAEATPEASSKGAIQRSPFILLFRSSVQQVVPQGLYALSHQELGLLEMFIVPAGRNPDGVEYAATFN